MNQAKDIGNPMMCQFLICYKTSYGGYGVVNQGAAVLISLDISPQSQSQSRALTAKMYGADCVVHITTPFDESLASIIDQHLVSWLEGYLTFTFSFAGSDIPSTETVQSVLKGLDRFERFAMETPVLKFCVSTQTVALAYATVFDGYVVEENDVHAAGLSILAITAGLFVSWPQLGGPVAYDEFMCVFGTADMPAKVMDGIWLMNEKTMLFPGVYPEQYFQKHAITLSMPVQPIRAEAHAKIYRYLSSDNGYCLGTVYVFVRHHEFFTRELLEPSWIPVKHLVREVTERHFYAASPEQ